MTQEEIHRTVLDFAKAAKHSKQANEDVVQIHCAHGYLISQFLSPIYNKRKGNYGGDIDGRSRILFETYDAIQQTVGKDFPIWIKINSKDLHPQGLSFEECLYICEELEKRGVDGIEVSGGIANGLSSLPCKPVKNESQEGTFLDEAKIMADKLNTPVISVGGHRTPQLLDDILNSSKVSAISLSRPLICEPHLVKRWKSGELQKSKCISCNYCLISTKELKCKIK